MDSFFVSAPGKVILFGEHAVVHEKVDPKTAQTNLTSGRNRHVRLPSLLPPRANPTRERRRTPHHAQLPRHWSKPLLANLFPPPRPVHLRNRTRNPRRRAREIATSPPRTLCPQRIPTRRSLCLSLPLLLTLPGSSDTEHLLLVTQCDSYRQWIGIECEYQCLSRGGTAEIGGTYSSA